MSISRQLPRSSNSRYGALQAAKQKKDSVAAAAKAITAATETRLDAVTTQYGTAQNTLHVAKAQSVLSTQQKMTLLVKQQLLNSHYIQVFNMHIEQGIYPAAHRAFFGIDTNSVAVPSNSAEADILQLSQNIINGEPNLIAAGGAAIPFPLKTTIATALAALQAKLIDQSNKKDATDKAQEAIEKLNTEVDAVIKKVWDEVETFFNEEPTESLRRKSREWGVVYISSDTNTTLTGIVQDAATNLPIAGATISIVSSDEAAVTTANGSFELKTGTTDAQVLHIEKAGYTSKEINLTIVAGVAQDLGTITL